MPFSAPEILHTYSSLMSCYLVLMRVTPWSKELCWREQQLLAFAAADRSESRGQTKHDSYFSALPDGWGQRLQKQTWKKWCTGPRAHSDAAMIRFTTQLTFAQTLLLVNEATSSIFCNRNLNCFLCYLFLHGNIHKVAPPWTCVKDKFWWQDNLQVFGG